MKLVCTKYILNECCHFINVFTGRLLFIKEWLSILKMYTILVLGILNFNYNRISFGQQRNLVIIIVEVWLAVIFLHLFVLSSGAVEWDCFATTLLHKAPAKVTSVLVQFIILGCLFQLISI